MRLTQLIRQPISEEEALASELAKLQAADKPKQAKGKREGPSLARQALHKANRLLTTVEVLDRLKKECIEIWRQTEVVGKWCWVSTPMAPSKEIRDYLYDVGFHFNWKRKVWQHPCGSFSGHSKSEPRARYDSIPARELEEDGASLIITDLNPGLRRMASKLVLA